MQFLFETKHKIQLLGSREYKIDVSEYLDTGPSRSNMYFMLPQLLSPWVMPPCDSWFESACGKPGKAPVPHEQ